MNNKTAQIGVMGSMADLKPRELVKRLAEDLGKEIAKAGVVLVYGFEGDFDSLSVIAAREAEKNGGKTLAFLWGPKGSNLGELRSLRIETGQLRGGGREFPLVLSCDAIICLGGGSGTLTEITIAYQANIPIVVIEKTGGWSEKLADTFLDERKRIKIIKTENARKAVQIAIRSMKTF